MGEFWQPKLDPKFSLEILKSRTIGMWWLNFNCHMYWNEFRWDQGETRVFTGIRTNSTLLVVLWQPHFNLKEKKLIVMMGNITFFFYCSILSLLHIVKDIMVVFCEFFPSIHSSHHPSNPSTSSDPSLYLCASSKDLKSL